MEPTSHSYKKNRRRVADSIQPQKQQQPSSVASLLAALDKAQKGESSTTTSTAKPEEKRLSVGETVRRIRKEKEGEKKKKTNVGVIGQPPTTPKSSRNQAQVERTPKSTPKSSRSRGDSVGARMSQPPEMGTTPTRPPTQGGGRRQRNNSTNVQTFVNKQYAMSVSLTPRGPGPAKSQPGSSQKGPPIQRIPSDVVDDLGFRFIDNIPDHEKFDSTRMCFQLEQAHWFYVDFYCQKEERADCPKLGMREFARQMALQHEELGHLDNIDQVIDDWRHYKSNVPTYGAILLDSSLNNVLLVQGYYASKNSWGFPKGKVNENEDPRICAIREVFEETGFDFSEISKGNEPRLRKFINDTMVQLFIVTDVPGDFHFSPRTRNEIRKIQWFNVWDLPTDRNDQVHRLSTASNNNFYTVMPFVLDLQNYIRKELARRSKNATKLQKNDLSSYYMTGIGKELIQELQSFSSQFPKSAQNDPSSISHLFNNFYQSPSTSTSKKIIPPPEPLSATKTSAPEKRSEKPPSDIPLLSTHSHFRPVGNSPAGGIAESAGSSIIQMLKAGPSTSSVPPSQIAHPIPIQAKAVIAPPVKPASTSSGDTSARANRISLSETSAFKAIPSSKAAAPLSVEPQVSTSQIENELQKLLCSPRAPASTAGSTAVRQDSARHRDSVQSTATDITSELVFPLGSARPAPIVPVGTATVGQVPRVQLCDAWKSFKLDRNAIFNGLPGFSTMITK